MLECCKKIAGGRQVAKKNELSELLVDKVEKGLLKTKTKIGNGC